MSRLIELHIGSLATPAEEVIELLDFLPVLYPGGDIWLPRALAEVESGVADGFEVRVDGKLAGVLLGRIKSAEQYKIRTLFVAPAFRGRGLGRSLVRDGMRVAAHRGAKHAYITFAHTLESQIAPLLKSEGFREEGNAINRYGVGRHEVVYTRAL